MILINRIKRTWIWKWGGGTVKIGWSAVAFLTLFAFAIYAQIQSQRAFDRSAETAENQSKASLEISTLNLQLTYQIQLTDYAGCIRATANQESVIAFDRKILDYATQEGLDVSPLYSELNSLFIPIPPCVEPEPPDLIINGELND